MKEIIEKIEKQDDYFEHIYQSLENIYREMPSKIDVNKVNLEEDISDLKIEVEKIYKKLDQLIYLFENSNL